jgi:uncharacterized protein YdgA (DUF945 family)
VKKSVIALILFMVLIIIVSPAIVGKLAEDSVGDNLNWVAEESGELVVTSDGFDRGWFSSEGQHRVALGDGNIRSAMSTAADDFDEDEIPVLLINTHIDHGLIPVSSMGREEGSLTPGLGSAVSTLSIELESGETIDLPGTIFSKLGLGGDLDSRYVLEAGAQTVDDGEVTWQPSTIRVAASAATGDVEFEGDMGTMTFGNDQQTVSIDSLSFAGQQAGTPYGFKVGDVDMSMGLMTVNAGGMRVGGMQGMNVTASSSVEDGLATAAMRLEMSGQTVPGFGDISVIADADFDSVDAVALGAVAKRLEDLSGAQDPAMVMMTAEKEIKDLLAAGINFGVDQFDVALPMGTVTSRMSFEVPKSDRAVFEWTSLLLDLVGEVYISVPEELVQLATSMDPQAGALVGMGYLKKDGSVYVLDAQMKKGLLTINGAPIPIPMGAFQ